MSANNSNSDSVQTHSIEANDDLVRSVIVDQTDNLEKGWREVFQNIIDSDASEGKLEYTSEYTRVTDNGQGVELTEQKGIDLLTVMGESSKDADDHQSIGEFGIGKGQIIAKGRTVFFSGDTALMFDIKGWGLEAKTVPMSDASMIAAQHDKDWASLIDQHFGRFSRYDGLAVLVDHYEDEVPSEDSYKWSKFEDNIKNRFRYLNNVKRTRLYVNDELITNQDCLDINSYGNVTHSEVYEGENTGEVHIAVKHGHGNLTVYSGGIKVCDVDSRGLAGRIVTEKNLRLNFARNEIKSGCPIWNDVRQRLDEIRTKIFSEVSEDRLRPDARKFISDRLFNHDEFEKYADAKIFETANENVVSWSEITEQDEIGMAPKGNPAADKLAEAYDEIVLNEDDPAVRQFDQNRDEIEEAPDDYDAEPRAEEHGLHVSYAEVSENEITPTHSKQLGIARYILDQMDIDMEIRWGESDVANAWTDGHNFIVLTEDAADSSRWIQWVPEIWQTLLHELAHRKDTSQEEPSHGVGFQRRFREKIESDGGIDALSELMGEIQDRSLSEVAEIGHHKAS